MTEAILPSTDLLSRPVPLSNVMRAAVLYGQRDVRLEDCPTPVPGPGEVLIRVEAALTDGTDLKVYRRGYHARMIVPPALFGHEFAGSVASVGPGVDNWPTGQRVVAANSAPCGRCWYCEKGQESLCEDLVFVNGAYAPFLLLPARVVEKNLLRLRSSTPACHAALTEPLACVVKGLRDLGVRRGENVAVIGSGPIGLMAVRLITLAGAFPILCGRRQEQLRIGEKIGARIVPAPVDPADLPRLLSEGGRGPDCVFEATGIPAVWEAAIETVRRGGKVNLFGGCPAGTRASFDTNRIHYGEISLFGSFHHTPADIRTALDLIESGAVQPDPLFDGVEPLDRLPTVLDEMDRRVRFLKTVIVPERLPR